MKKIKKIILIALCVCFGIALICGISLLSINGFVKYSTMDRILSAEQAAELKDVDCILVLGCGVWDDGRPSHMLEDRLKRSMELYELEAAPKLLMSGDHGRDNYDEVAVMKAYAITAGAPSRDVFMDHAGFSTYESIYRAKAIFKAEKIIIVTQEYHLHRALYIARSFGLDAYGVSSDYRGYSGQAMREIREILARIKDFGSCILRPHPTYLGDAIPIWGDGNLTNDENNDFTGNGVKE